MKFLLALSLLPITAMAWESPSEIVDIYSYQCEATFLEGEGVQPNNITCLANQHLGKITARYTHYLYSGDSGDNFHNKGADEWYLNICGANVQRVKCSDNEPEHKFSLSRHKEDIFQVAVSLTASRISGAHVYGYAARTENGSCPKGLKQVWTYRATPASIQWPLPSSFVNWQGNLNNFEVRSQPGELPSFDVYRQANTFPCNGWGNCSMATFGEKQLVQSVNYVRDPRISVCVLE